MRLTLRTLLAYLDDMLEPAQTKELGAKIQDSEMAADLIMRIRDAVRKRRLGAPIVSGPGADVDANLVAEYLDNTLAPDDVADLEQICLESDMHLAEVAACHQILTMALGEPVDIQTHSRERMYALVAASGPRATTNEQAKTPESVSGGHRLPAGVPTGSVASGPAAAGSTAATTASGAHRVPTLDPQRRGDSFISKAPAHPSASPPARVATTTRPGQSTGASGVLSSDQIHSPTPSDPAQPAGKSAIAPDSLSASAAAGPTITARATTPAALAAPSPQQANLVQTSSADSIDRTIPDYLKQPPLWRRALPLAILLLIAVWVGTLIKDRNLFSGLNSANRPDAVAVNATPTKSGNPAAAEIAAVDSENRGAENRDSDDLTPETPASEKVGQQEPITDLVQQQPEVVVPGQSIAKAAADEVAMVEPGVDAPPPADAGDQPPAKSAGPAGLDDEDAQAAPQATRTGSKDVTAPSKSPAKRGTEVAVAETSKPANVGKNVGQSQPVPTTPILTDKAAQPLKYVSREGVVLRFDDDRQGWYPLPHGQSIFAEDILAVPEPFDAQIQIGKEKHRLTAIGPALFQIIESVDDHPLTVSVERGRMVLQLADTSVDGAASRLRFALNIQGQTWLLELPDPHSRCGIEVTPREPHQFEENFGALGWHGKLYIASGTVKVTNPDNKVQIYTAPDTLVLAADPAATTPPVPAGTTPTWMSGERKLTSSAKLNAAHFQKILTEDDLSAHEALLSAVGDRVPEKSRLASACLALIGDYQMLLEILDRNEHHESREAAISGLRAWVNLHPANREKLKEEISEHFSKDDIETLYRLIWGYQDQDLRSKQTSRQLVDWLSHESLAVRELAYYNIKTLTNRRLEFDARGSATQRNAAIQQLEKVLDKDGSLLPSLPKGASANVRRNKTL